MDAALCGDDPEETRVLTRVLWAEAERTSISEKDRERILAPLKKRIMADEFTGRLRRGYFFRLAASAAAMLILAAAMAQSEMSGRPVHIADATVPLSASVAAGKAVSGRVVMKGLGAEGIALALVNAETNGAVRAAVTGEEGSFEFEGLPPGRYRVIINMPPGPSLTEEAGGGEWAAPDGRTEIEIGAGGSDEWEGLEIEICRSWAQKRNAKTGTPRQTRALTARRFPP